MKKLVQLAVVAVALSSLAGCQLCLLPCYICALGSGGGQTIAIQENKEIPLPEVGPNFISKSLLADGAAAATH